MTLIKIDIDVKPPKTWIEQWLKTRLWLLEKLNYNTIFYSIYESSKGYHVYFEIKENISKEEIAKLQFLLGDDHQRVYFNLMRLAWNDDKVSQDFNILFDTYRKTRFKINRKTYKPESL